ncbi:hypothetical protein WMY93_019488 [Mugilogobius chulae]|uniref:Mediator of RNA polymerase II transcription subunit 10 n=2 Tax=Gobiidae TaxID=8220 RepID=A0AAW0NED3_9GOBI
MTAGLSSQLIGYSLAVKQCDYVAKVDGCGYNLVKRFFPCKIDFCPTTSSHIAVYKQSENMAEKFDNLEEHLEKFIENIRQLGIIVSDFQPSSQAGLNQKLNFMISGLQDIEKCRQQLHEINVPLEVFEYIDQGRNPQLYTKECLERALARNEQVKGKIDTMTKFKSLLISELSKVFPEDMAKYKAMRAEDPPS